MELTLTLQGSTTVAVSCDEGPSHTFDLNRLLPAEKISGRPPQPLDDPLAYGQAVYQALFPPRSLAARLLDSELKRLASQRRLLLVAGGTSLEAIPWEYARSSDSWLVCDLPFVRGLPASERRPAPVMESGLHVVALASSPLGKDIAPLNVEGEWQTLKEAFGRLEHAAVLERARPATIDELRRRVTGRKQSVIHFMGHGGQADGQFALFFEKEDGAPNPVRGRDLVNRLGEAAFLVVMSACVSAASGATEFDNLAAALVKWGTPYGLGMRFAIPDEDAPLFARAFYDELAADAPVEQAAWQARIKLLDSRHDWMVGVPVLYTALQSPAAGFACTEGAPQIKDPRPEIDLYALSLPEGGLQGRIEEQLWLGERLTGDKRPRLLTILGVGGQGKSALARVAAERFAWAWPGGVYAASLENLPRREDFALGLAGFLGIETPSSLAGMEQVQDLAGFQKPVRSAAGPEELEKQILNTLERQHTLLVLDNAETLVNGLDSPDAETARRARSLAGLLQRLLEAPTVTLLATARRPLGWVGEETRELEGLSPTEGVHLFRQCTSQRAGKVYLKEAEMLSRKLDGHPLSLRLLGAAFNDSTLSLKEFILDYDRQLLQAADKYKDADARQRSLYTCLEASKRTLDDETRALLAGLTIFEAPFLAEFAVMVFDPDLPDDAHSVVLDRLQTLTRCSLLEKSERILRDGTVELYHLAAAVRLYAASYLKPGLAPEDLHAQFGRACAGLVSAISDELDRSAKWVYIAQQGAPDLERAAAWLEKAQLGEYLAEWGLVNGSLGNPIRALDLFTQALPIVQEIGDRTGEATLLINLGAIYRATGQLDRALELFERAIPIQQEIGDRAGEAAALANIGAVYQATGQLEKALELYKQDLPITREVGNRKSEAITLNNMGIVYQDTGQPQRALELYQQALLIRREIGNRTGEATTLNNIATVYGAAGQSEQALEMYQQALVIRREMGDQAGEAVTLNNIGMVHQDAKRALEMYEQVLTIQREISDRAGEAATLGNMALALHYRLKRTTEAIPLIQQSISILKEYHLPQDAAGKTLADHEALLAEMQSAQQPPAPPVDQPAPPAAPPVSPADQPASPAAPPAPSAAAPHQPPAAHLTTEQLQMIAGNTLAALTTAPDKLPQWRTALRASYQQAQRANAQAEIELFAALLALLDQVPPALSADSPYAGLVQAIQRALARGEAPEGAEDAADIPPELGQAVQALLQAQDLPSLRQVIEQHKKRLYTPDALELLDGLAKEANQRGARQDAQVLAFYATLLQRCRQSGIPAVFEELAQSGTPGAPAQDEEPFESALPPARVVTPAGAVLPPDFVARCVAGLSGVKPEREALFNYLAGIPVTDPGCATLLKDLKLWLLGSNPRKLGQKLEGPYAAAWQEIISQV
jgi:tetratricopeptide (TPR) repeat protein